MHQFYAGHDSRRYVREKIAMMQIIIDSLRPDYLTMEMEPATMVANTGGRVDFSVDSMLSYVRQYCAALRRGRVPFLSFFWCTLLYGRLSYNDAAHGSMSDAELLLEGQQIGAQVMIAGELSVLGEATLAIASETCADVNGLPTDTLPAGVYLLSYSDALGSECRVFRVVQ